MIRKDLKNARADLVNIRETLDNTGILDDETDAVIKKMIKIVNDNMEYAQDEQI